MLWILIPSVVMFALGITFLVVFRDQLGFRYFFGSFPLRRDDCLWKNQRNTVQKALRGLALSFLKACGDQTTFNNNRSCMGYSRELQKDSDKYRRLVKGAQRKFWAAVGMARLYGFLPNKPYTRDDFIDGTVWRN